MLTKIENLHSKNNLNNWVMIEKWFIWCDWWILVSLALTWDTQKFMWNIITSHSSNPYQYWDRVYLLWFIYFLNESVLILIWIIGYQQVVTWNLFIFAWTWSIWGAVLHWIHTPSLTGLWISLLFAFIILISWKFT